MLYIRKNKNGNKPIIFSSIAWYLLSRSLLYYISGLFADMGGIVTVRLNNVRQGTEEGGTWEEKRSGG